MQHQKAKNRVWITLFGWCCLRLDYFCSNLRVLAFNHNSVFEFLFLFIYTLEQILLVFFTYLFANSSQILVFSISIMAVLILSTFALHKMTIHSRMKLLEKQLADAMNDKYAMEKRVKESQERIQRKIEEILFAHNSKNLYKTNLRNKIVRGVRDEKAAER